MFADSDGVEEVSSSVIGTVIQNRNGPVGQGSVSLEHLGLIAGLHARIGSLAGHSLALAIRHTDWRQAVH